MKRAILAVLAALLLIASPVAGAIILKEEPRAPTLVGEPAFGAIIAYDFADRYVAHHHCQEVYAFNSDGSIVLGPAVQFLFLAPGEAIALDDWPATSWAQCGAHLLRADTFRGVGHSDLLYLVPPQ